MMDSQSQATLKVSKNSSFDNTKGMFLLGIVTIIMVLTLPFSFLAPVPLALGLLTFSKKDIILFVGTICLMTGVLVAILPQVGLPSIVLLLTSLAYSYLVTRGIKQNTNPIDILIFSGAIVVVCGFTLLLLFKLFSDVSLSDQIANIVKESVAKVYSANKQIFDSASSDEARAWKEIFANPEILVKKVLWWLPGFFFISGYLVIWVTLSLVLKYKRVWRSRIKFNYTVRDLMKFTTPDWFVYVLILGLVMAFIGNYSKIIILESIGVNTLISIALFYFFEGIGVYHDFLRAIKIVAPFSSFLILIMIFSGWELLVIIGLLNYWVNFRKFMKKKDI